jgi:hypothetical protein
MKATPKTSVVSAPKATFPPRALALARSILDPEATTRTIRPADERPM